MNRVLRFILPLLVIVALVAPLRATAQAAAPEPWLHIRVESHKEKGELVRVNVPLSLAEKVIPAIHNERLHEGKISIRHPEVNGVDVRVILEAVRTTRDGEFVTIQGTTGEVRVSKQGGYLLVNAREKKEGAEEHRVEIKVPMSVVDALISSGKEELDVLAAIRALAAHGPAELVRIKDEENTVRVWVDAKNTSD